MRLKTLFLAGCAAAGMALFAVPATAAAVHECPAGKPTAASYTWDFKGEADMIFSDIQADAQQALYHADKLQSYARDTTLDWQPQGDQLDAIREEVNAMGTRLCRLETIRRVVAPWQQAEIDRIASTMRLMADNTQDALVFGNAHRDDLWLPTYQRYTRNLYDEARTLEHSVGSAVAYANASHEYHNLRRTLGMPS